MCTYIHTCRNPHPKIFFNFALLPTDQFGIFHGFRPDVFILHLPPAEIHENARGHTLLAAGTLAECFHVEAIWQSASAILGVSFLVWEIFFHL